MATRPMRSVVGDGIRLISLGGDDGEAADEAVEVDEKVELRGVEDDDEDDNDDAVGCLEDNIGGDNGAFMLLLLMLAAAAAASE